MGDLLGRLGLDPASSPQRGLSQRAIARQLGIARDTVAAAVASDGPPKYERSSVPSAIDAVEPRIRALLSTYPQLPATVIAERVGWTGSISWFRERVRAIRPEYLPADPVDRLAHPPGRVVQCDLWFPAPKIAVGFGQESMLPVLVMVAAFSRFIAAVMLPSRQTMDLVAGMWQLLAGSFAAVPHELWWERGRDRTSGSVDRSGDGVDGHVGVAAGATQAL
jgi:transposase